MPLPKSRAFVKAFQFLFPYIIESILFTITLILVRCIFVQPWRSTPTGLSAAVQYYVEDCYHYPAVTPVHCLLGLFILLHFLDHRNNLFDIM